MKIVKKKISKEYLYSKQVVKVKVPIKIKPMKIKRRIKIIKSILIQIINIKKKK